MARELMFVRNNPFYDDWKDWPRICHDWHCPRTLDLQEKINKGHWRNYNMDDYSKNENDFIVEIHSSCAYLRRMFTSTEKEKFVNTYSDFSKFSLTSAGFPCSCWMSDDFQNCIYRVWHMRTRLISLMWSFIDLKFCPRNMKKYYKRLERVVLVLPENKLKLITPEMLFEPAKFKEFGKHLLFQFYRRTYLDELENVEDFAQKCALLRNFVPKQQGGNVYQSQSAISDELFEECYRLVELEDPTALLERFYRIKEQGLFSLTHDHSITDDSIRKIKQLLDESRESFTSSMASSLVIAGKNLMAVFAVATTTVVLAKAAAGFMFQAILKILHLLYGLIFGPDCMSGLDRVKQQGGEVDFSIPFLPTVLLKYVLGAPDNIMKNIWRNPNIDMIMRRISYFGDPKIDRGLDRITEWIISVLNMTRAWYFRQVLGISVPDDITSDAHAIQAWNEEVDVLLKSYFSNEFVWSETSWSMVYNLYARGLSFTRSRLYDRWKSDVFRVVNKLGNILEKFKQHQRDGQTIRNPPVTIYLSGGTGVGKSSVTYPLAAEILKDIFQREGQVTDLHKIWKSLIYMRSAEQEFWDGYENQFVTVFDDFNQQADSTSNPNLELFEIIRASNCFPYPLHMASLDQKATTTFTSKIIIVSSNLAKPKTQSLNFPDALTRRFDICVKVERKPEFAGKLDKFNPDVYIFFLYDMATNKLIKQVSYSELVKMCSEEYFSRCSFVDSIDSYIDSVLRPAQQQGPPTFEEQVEEIVEDEKRLDDWAWDEYPDPIPQLVEDTQNIIAKKIRFSINKEIRESGERGKLMSDYLFIRPYQTRRDPYDNRNIFRRMYDWWRDVTPNYWEECQTAVNNLKLQYNNLISAWAEFRENHPYIFKSIMVVSFIVGALVFLKMFNSISNLVSKNKVKNGSPMQEQWRMGMRTTANQAVAGSSLEYPPIRTVKSESYTPSAPKSAKAEAYTPAAIKTAKAEAYSPAVIRAARAEAIEYDPATGLPVAQGVKDLNATEIMHSLIRRNLYKMYESTNDTPIGHCIFLRGKVAVMPRHFIYAFKQSLRNDPDAVVYFRSALLTRCFDLRVSELLETVQAIDSPSEEYEAPETRDLISVSVSSSIVHPDISPMVATRNSLSQVRSTEVVLPVVVRNNVKGSDTPILVFRFRKGSTVLRRVESLPVGSDSVEVLRYIRDAWRYEMDTQSTECGAPLIARNSHLSQGKICGLHVAGLDGTGEGFATPFYQEDVAMILSKYAEKETFQQVEREKLKEFPKEQGQVPEEAVFIRHGALEKSLFQPKKTRIVPSLCHAKIKEPESKPCQLRPTEDFDPRKYRLQRLGNVPQAIPRDVVENAGKAFLDECSSVIAANPIDRTVIKAVYSFEEAITGIDGEIYVNSIKRNTSPGYPFVIRANTNTRKAFFGEDQIYDLNSPQCKQLQWRVNEIIQNAKQGIVLDHYFVDTLKDERKPIHKAHKTRLFSAGPLDYLVACKMYFNGVVALLQKNRNWSHVSVGTNPYSQDWAEIARSLFRKSELMVAGDFEGFDASQHQKLLEEAGEVFIQLAVIHLGATEEDVRVMRVLLVSLINSFHICGKEVYQWTHSLPSGHYLTAPINSVFVNLVFCCIWQIAFNNVSYKHARSFWIECGIVAYGDDHIVSIPRSRIEVFNQLSIPQPFQRIGLSYTMEDKDAIATRPYRSLNEVSYLKRGFYRDTDGEWLAPLSLGTVLETPMWMHECPDPELQTVENLEWAIKELSLHSPSVWKDWFPVLDRELRSLGHFTQFCRQMEVREVVKSGGCDLAF